MFIYIMYLPESSVLVALGVLVVTFETVTIVVNFMSNFGCDLTFIIYYFHFIGLGNQC